MVCLITVLPCRSAVAKGPVGDPLLWLGSPWSMTPSLLPAAPWPAPLGLEVGTDFSIFVSFWVLRHLLLMDMLFLSGICLIQDPKQVMQIFRVSVHFYLQWGV